MFPFDDVIILITQVCDHSLTLVSGHEENDRTGTWVKLQILFSITVFWRKFQARHRRISCDAPAISAGVDAWSEYHGDTPETMMTSSNGNIFSATGHLCGNSPCDFPWPETKDSNVNNRDAGYLRRHRAHYDVIVMPFLRKLLCRTGHSYCRGPLAEDIIPALYSTLKSNSANKIDGLM